MVAREWHAKRDARARCEERGRDGNEIGSLIADTERMLRDCENSNLREGT